MCDKCDKLCDLGTIACLSDDGSWFDLSLRTSLKTFQDMNADFSFNRRCLNGTFPSIKSLVYFMEQFLQGNVS